MFLDEVHFPPSKDKKYLLLDLLQELSTLENIKYILALGGGKYTPSKNPFLWVC